MWRCRVAASRLQQPSPVRKCTRRGKDKCAAPDGRVAGKRRNHSQAVMQTILLCGAPSSETPLVGYFGSVLLRIKEPDVSDAINLSVALKRPERSVGGITDSSASNFTDGSTRVYISVVCMCAWPSHSATFRRSLVACRTVRAQVCRNT